MSFWSGPPPDPPPHLKPTFWSFGGGGGGGVGRGFKKLTPPFFGSKIMNRFVFFDFEPKNVFWVPTPWGLYGAEWDER